MNVLKYIAVNICETLLRVFPFPCKTGLIKIGNPDRNSPVFLTCNYHLTVERVKRRLGGIDCYLLVADSRGMNVWCAATGGRFTNQDVISVLKESGIEELVAHRNVILPQLAASGIESKVIRENTGWKVVWGPVYAKDIPAFIRNDSKKTPEMRAVSFPWIQRIELAVSWSFPFSVVMGVITILFWREAFLPVTILVWSLPFLIFISFPFYRRWLDPKKAGTSFSKYTILFDFGRIPLLLWGIFLFCLAVCAVLLDAFTWRSFVQWGFISFVLVFLVSIDLMGSTPLYKSGLHEDRLLKCIIDEKKCKTAGCCEQVCPRICFMVNRERRVTTMPGADRCVQCGACLVQCPFDALCFEGPNGEITTAETIRKFKLNLLSKRLVKVR